MDELRRCRIVASGPSAIERLVAAVVVAAERHVAGQLTRGLSPSQTKALEALLASKEGTSISVGVEQTGCRRLRTCRIKITAEPDCGCNFRKSSLAERQREQNTKFVVEQAAQLERERD
jgi:hypothetical protein